MINVSKVTEFIYTKIHGVTEFFVLSYERQYEYLYRFEEPKTAMDRSFYQCKCELYTSKFYVVFLKQFISLLLFIFYAIYLLIKRKNEKIYIKQNIGVHIADSNNLYYKELFKSFDKIESVLPMGDYYLRMEDVLFILKLVFSHPLYPYWLIKNIYKIALYRSIIDKFNPKAIICSSEYSFTSSVLTLYCENYSIQHINIMHGEKFFFIRDAFFYFHQCYVWDEGYIQLFNKLRSRCNQYVVCIPENLKLDIKNDNYGFTYKMTYYLDVEDAKGLLAIKESLLKTKFKPAEMAIRYHPHYSELFPINLIYNTFNNFVIEDPKAVSLIESLSRTEFVVSLYSSVLYQAYLSGKSIVMDDISFPDKYKKLKDFDYIIFKKDHINLSRFIDS
jgi:hypothetical protein